MATKAGFLSSTIVLLALLASLSSASAKEFKRCGVGRHVPVLRVVDKVLGKDPSGQVYADVWVIMNTDSAFVRDMKVRPDAVTQFNGTLQFALPDEGGVYGVGISLSNQSITATVPTKLRIAVKHRAYQERLLAIPAKKLEAWVCHRSFTYDHRTSIIIN
ncbi:hypothetical protein [Shinella sp.]|uniref:hypothetical protein n=1 Tax=Shinella sp. TaxID=1870904 RepID=UPI0029A2EDC1|nr:hypothetical protein [Shinella sp.]MDX3977590.1 hypothetical protein [Shinella sp.]